MSYKVGDCIIFNRQDEGIKIGTIIIIEFDPRCDETRYIVETAIGERFVVNTKDILGLEKDLFTVNADDIKYKGVQGALNDAIDSHSNPNDPFNIKGPKGESGLLLEGARFKTKTWHIKIPSDIEEISFDLSDEHYVLPVDIIMDIIKKYAKEVKE